MVKKISFSILALAILAVGIYAFTKINYWERSIRIFSYDSAASFNGRGGRGQGGFDGRRIPGERSDFNRPDFNQLPDSVRARFEAGRGRPDAGRGRGEFPVGNSISIRNVQWFLAVFAMFTVIAIYLDKAICLIRKRNKTTGAPGKP